MNTLGRFFRQIGSEHAQQSRHQNCYLLYAPGNLCFLSSVYALNLLEIPLVIDGNALRIAVTVKRNTVSQHDCDASSMLPWKPKKAYRERNDMAKIENVSTPSRLTHNVIARNVPMVDGCEAVISKSRRSDVDAVTCVAGRCRICAPLCRGIFVH